MDTNHPKTVSNTTKGTKICETRQLEMFTARFEFFPGVLGTPASPRLQTQ